MARLDERIGNRIGNGIGSRRFRLSCGWFTPIAQSYALRGEHVATAVFWREARAERHSVWACAYSRVRWPASDRASLFAPDVDASTPARRSPPRVAA